MMKQLHPFFPFRMFMYLYSVRLLMPVVFSISATEYAFES